MIARKTIIAAASVAVILGGGATALATSGTLAVTAATTANFDTGCVTSAHTLAYLYKGSHSCASGQVKFTWNITGPAGPKGATGATGAQGATGPQGPAGPSDLTVSTSTSVSNRDDSGGNGNWATDAMVRMVTITRHEAAAVANCGDGAVTCWYYTATLTDSGTFTTQPGAFTPNQGLDNGQKISGTVNGNFTGGSHIEFYASSNAPNASLVPATVSGDSPSTTNWVEQAFPGGTVFSVPSLLDWSWSYNAPATCEHWTDAFNNSGGQSKSAGDITGVNACA